MEPFLALKEPEGEDRQRGDLTAISYGVLYSVEDGECVAWGRLAGKPTSLDAQPLNAQPPLALSNPR